MDATYVNVIRRKDGKLVVHTAGTTREMADAIYEAYKLASPDRVSCIKVELTRGVWDE